MKAKDKSRIIGSFEVWLAGTQDAFDIEEKEVLDIVTPLIKQSPVIERIRSHRFIMAAFCASKSRILCNGQYILDCPKCDDESLCMDILGVVEGYERV